MGAVSPQGALRMRTKGTRRQAEAGVVLLIAIFVLMLISVVAIALIVSSGTETALASNYRSSATVYYAAMAGLEEARSRLQTKNPDYFNKTQANFLPPSGTPLTLTEVRYITNPSPTDADIDPSNAGDPYFDTEYGRETGTPITSGTLDVKRIPSVSANNAANIPGPVFKWVRINAVTESWLNLDVDGDGTKESATALYYNPAQTTPSLILSATPPPTAVQALEVTSLAVLPDGSQKMLQYVVAATPINIPTVAALTLSGPQTSHATFMPPANNTNYAVTGMDYDCNGSALGVAKVPAIGIFPNPAPSDISTYIKSNIPLATQPSYKGSGGGPPDVDDITATFPANLQLPSKLDALAQSIIQNADAILTPSAPGTAYSPELHTVAVAAGMSPTSPITLVVNGNLDITDWGTGDHEYGPAYGLLLVTGTFTYDPDTNWNGMILVIGKGIVNNTARFANEAIHGAMLVAQTRDASGNLLSDSDGLGGASISFHPTMGGTGILYSSCWVQRATPVARYQLLSFREIPQS